MTSVGSSLTTSTDSSERNPTPARNHLSSGKNRKSHLTPLTSLNTKQTSVASCMLNPPQSALSLGQLTGYASSEEEGEGEGEAQPGKENEKKATKPTRTSKQRKTKSIHEFKSAEFVTTDIESEASLNLTQQESLPKKRTAKTRPSENLTSLSTLSTHSPGKSKRVFAPRKARESPSHKHSNTSSSPSKMNHKLRNSGKPVTSGGHSIKKRPVSPTASIASAKRSKMKAGFVMDSDDSEAEGYDDDGKDDDSIPAVPPPPPQRLTLDGRSAVVNAAPLPTKQLNKSRLNTLLGRNKDPNSHLRHSSQSSSARPTAATPPISTYKQRHASHNASHMSAPVHSNIQKTDAGLTQDVVARRSVIKEKQARLQDYAPPLPRGRSFQESDDGFQNLTVFVGSDALDRSLSRVPNQAVSRSSKKLTDSISRPISTQFQHGKAAKDADDTSRPSNQAVKARSSHTDATRSLSRTAPKAMKNAVPVPDPISQAHASGNKQCKEFDRPSALTTPAAQKQRVERQSQMVKPDHAPTSEGQLPRTAVFKQKGRPPSRQSPPHPQISTGTTVPGSQLPRPDSARSLRQKQDQGSVPQPPLAQNQTAGATSPKPKVAHGTKLVQKRMAEDTTGEPSANATPVKEPLMAPEQSSMAVRPTLNEPVRIKAGANSHGLTNVTTTSRPKEATKPLARAPPPTTLDSKSQSDSLDGTFSATPKHPSKAAGHDLSQQMDSRAATFRCTPTAPNGASSPKAPQKAATSTVDESTKISGEATIPTATRSVSRVPLAEVTSGSFSKPSIPAEESINHGQKQPTPTASHLDTSPTVAAIAKPSTADKNLEPACPMSTAESVPRKPSPVTPFTSLGPSTTVPHQATALMIEPATTVGNRTEMFTLSSSSGLSEDAEPYFEYTVFQKNWSSEQNEDNVMAREIVLHPFIQVDEANAQAEMSFQSLKDQYTDLQAPFSEWNSKRTEQDCLTCIGTYSLIDYPTRKSYVKIWVQRDCVSKYANRGCKDVGAYMTSGTCLRTQRLTPFIQKTAYKLRLCKLIPASDGADIESTGKTKPEHIPAYHKLPDVMEVHTTLDAANRAACKVQVELSHEKIPKKESDLRWQEQNLKDLNAKAHALDPSMGGTEGCWKSEFNACGMGGDKFELVVEKVGIGGPRN